MDVPSKPTPGSKLSKMLQRITTIYRKLRPKKKTNPAAQPRGHRINPQDQSLLLTLPAELRNKIYSLALLNIPSAISSVDSRIELRNLKLPNLARTCHLTQQEYLSYLFFHGKFVFTILVEAVPKLEIKSHLEGETKKWLTATQSWALEIRDIVFRIQLYDSRTARGFDTADFISIVRDASPRPVLNYTPLEAREACWENEEAIMAQIPRWKAIEEFSRGGMRIRDVEKVLRFVYLMSGLDSHDLRPVWFARFGVELWVDESANVFWYMLRYNLVTACVAWERHVACKAKSEAKQEFGEARLGVSKGP